MNNNIIERILADADNKAEDIVSTATANAEKLLGETKAKLESDYQQLVNRCSAEYDAIIANKLSNAELDIRKYRLQQKSNLIDNVYSQVLDRLKDLPRKQYLQFVGELIAKYATAGETVYTNKADQADIDSKFLDKHCQGLKLSIKPMDISGGVVLSTDNYDKVLTLENIVALARENDNSVVAALFGE